MISNSIASWGNGQWQDCGPLRKLWLKQKGREVTGVDNAVAQFNKPWPQASEHGIYLEVGTNIGACLVDMLMVSHMQGRCGSLANITATKFITDLFAVAAHGGQHYCVRTSTKKPLRADLYFVTTRATI